MAIGSRLRMLTEKVTEDAAAIYALYHIDLQPKWFPVFYILSQEGPKTITEIAREIGHSHPSVSRIVGEMTAHGLVAEEKDATDGRKNRIGLAPAGHQLAEAIQDQYADVEQAITTLSAQANHDLWQAIGEWEYLLEQKSLLRRVQEQQRKRTESEVQIVDYTPAYRQAFRDLNEAWISTYFKMEAADYKALDDPEGYILNRGGHILVALWKGQPVGVCALLKMDDPDYDYELAKMAVSPAAQGKNIGRLLGDAIVDRARQLGARNVFLESNTILKPAISLYHRLGFEKVTGRPTPYERANIQMVLDLQVPAAAQVQ
ncbi:MarR family transcriptional regulator with acetyltransferase activity [Taibaiella chishuiensis]|uniref:MarR family transcriptional regulator with acetyltransferase activity n=2 Tax=Taibaiella chishuiensis TaxID=1434707 RepID=A0A2P8CX80_9BACT|nr:MarR family transcriptional regulator with acetyltransferase activity [Taibaiella chishuiensis]